jgi:hypothetical protein
MGMTFSFVSRTMVRSCLELWNPTGLITFALCAAPPLWPSFVFTERFFNRDAYGAAAIQACIDRCQRKNREIAGRILRLQQACPSLSSVGGGQVLAATMRNEAQILQTLDRFHRVDSTSDLHRVYSEVFSPLPIVSPSGSGSPAELPVDVAALFLVCEWAVTNQRPAEYRYLSALALIEMHSNALLEYGKEYVFGFLCIDTPRS